MTILRRSSQLLAVAAIAVTAVLLILEVTGLIGGGWRQRLAEGVEKVVFPGWQLWISSLVGVAISILGLVTLFAQLAPPRRGYSTMHEVHRADDGETWIRGRAAIGAVRHELQQVDGVVGVDASIKRKQVDVRMRIDHQGVLTEIENEARQRLDHKFWISLGLADYAVNILVTYDPRPPRVR